MPARLENLRGFFEYLGPPLAIIQNFTRNPDPAKPRAAKFYQKAEEAGNTKESVLHAKSCLPEPFFSPLLGKAEERKTDDVNATGILSS